ncbi:MAG TPA: methyltransferase domain-containing protein [Pyrinomonadaceae bacterium]|nr:methyltransferase domain-containing protein [Pyrinomonadaceae bacterium]
MHDLSQERTLSTSIGDFPLNEYCLNENGREWRVLHVGAIISHDEEAEYLLSPKEMLPYGVTLWASSIALAHDLATRKDLRGKNVLELGAGTGLPGIVAASGGARLVQTDNNKVALTLARRNLDRSELKSVEQRAVDWVNWNDTDRYDLILGSDILYSKEMQPHLRRIFESNLAAGGRVLLSDPFRATAINFFETLERNGWSIKISKWSVGGESSRRPIGVFELAPPDPGSS